MLVLAMILFVLKLGDAPAASVATMSATPSETSRTMTLQSIMDAPFRIVPSDSTGSVSDQLVLTRSWHGFCCQSRLANHGTRSVRVCEVVLFAGKHNLSGETRIYGEGFQMLSQTDGTVARPSDAGYFTDRDHYKIPQPAGSTTVYGLLMLHPPGGEHILMGFTSCKRFSGSFRLRDDCYEVVLDTENLELKPGEAWDLEEFALAVSPSREALLQKLAERIAVNHPPRHAANVPTGWCSWYCFGPGVTAAQIVANTSVIAKNAPGLRYLQIDDGYQQAMGDWLDTRADFGMPIDQVCRKIHDAGLEPAIWVAPFIAEEKSAVFQQHPDWFVQDDAGKPLRSDRVSFGGWRCGPWYCLDGTHPEVQKHLESLFRHMREEWGCTYFKLDANFWGAIHGGRHHDPTATRVEAYRRGMQAILRGAGSSFVLGCNHPIWPSLGLIDGSRSSMDIDKSWESIRHTAREQFYRNWQNGRLWYNDGDVLALGNSYHAASDQLCRASIVLATGGLVLAGDDMAVLPLERLAMLQQVLPPTGVAAQFEDDSFRIGTVDLPDRRLVLAFNWSDTSTTCDVPLPSPRSIQDFWSGQDLGRHDGHLRLDLPAHSARVLVLKP